MGSRVNPTTGESWISGTGKPDSAARQQLLLNRGACPGLRPRLLRQGRLVIRSLTHITPKFLGVAPRQTRLVRLRELLQIQEAVVLLLVDMMGDSAADMLELVEVFLAR